MDITIRYKQTKYRITNLIGTLWLIPGFHSLLTGQFPLWRTGAYFLLGIYSLFQLFLDKKHIYVSINSDSLKIDSLIGERKIKVKDVESIMQQDSLIIIKTKKRQFKINTRLINEDDLTKIQTLKLINGGTLITS